ncbi:MAG: quinone-dependent dihydroorotate dehydrogenase [Candidatus Paceibacterota bacterium]|jgi:dihydroorotate dehydrogenase
MIKDSLLVGRDTFLSLGYRYLLKPILFQFDPEKIHDLFTDVGEKLGRHRITRQLTSLCFGYEHPMLEQTIRGLKFKNPVGLAAGFDKDARLTAILAPVGFGFEEVGSITGEPCLGNPKPRLWRLPKSQSLIVHYGLKNAGASVVAKKLINRKFIFPVGISMAKTNSPDTVEITAGIDDYFKVYRTFMEAGIGDYFTINISCPNAFGGSPFTDPVRLDLLLTKISVIPKTKPIFIKMPPNLSEPEIKVIIELARKYKIDGFISTNLTKDRTVMSDAIKDKLPTEKGSLSGKPVQSLALDQIKTIRRLAGNEFVIIGCGGIFNADDAWQYFLAGASLLQLITGMIFEGPQLIGEINRGLVERLKKEGYGNISEIVGRN